MSRSVLARIMKKVKFSSSIITHVPNGFDASFYRSFYSDLTSIKSDGEAAAHYVRFGKSEGRLARAEEFLTPLEQEFGSLPEAFDAQAYRRLNPDVAGKTANVWTSTEHYLRYGRSEGRRYQAFDLELYKSLNGADHLNSQAEVLSHFREHQSSGLVARSGADFMNLRGIRGGGAWLERLNLQEFKTLNWRWAGDVENKLEAGDLMLREGIKRRAPLSFELRFDPTYYREAHPSIADLDDLALYRSWLFDGLESAEAGTAIGRLRQLGLELSEYPTAFNWRVYARQQKLSRTTQWAALEHFLHNTNQTAPPPLNPAGEEIQFLVVSAKSFSSRLDAYSILLLEKAQNVGELPAEARQIWGDCLYRSEAWPLAEEQYDIVLRSGSGNVWTLVNAVRSCLKMKRPTDAVAKLHEFGGLFKGEALFRSTVREVVEAIFKIREGQALLLYRKGERETADQLLRNATKECHDHWTDLDPMGAPIDRTSKAKIVVFANTDLRQCTHYRVEQKAEIFDAAGLAFEIFSADQDEAFIDALPGAAAAIFYRLPSFPKNVRAIETAKLMGIPTYYEIDDMIFDVAYPDPIETYGGSLTVEEYAGLQFGVPLFQDAMQRCDYGLTSTTALADQMKAFVRTGQVFTVVNGLDQRNMRLSASYRKIRADDDVVLFYGSGTKAHNTDFLDLVGPALIELFSSNEKVRLLIVGFLSLDERFQPLLDRITHVGFVPNIQAYWSILAEADINLAVLRPGPTTNGKSEIKWLEAAVLAVPSVVSNTSTYLQVVEDGVDGLIAGTQEQWKVRLRELVASPDRRAQIAKAAQRKAVDLYSLRANAERMKAALQPALRSKEVQAIAGKTVGRTSRILLVNVFFPPQTIGGATRVVRDNLDFFIEEGADRFAFGVATSDVAAAEPHRLRIDQYGRVPIFRISTPQEENMDWRPFNENTGAAFGRILEIYRPELVHFHATQRLTASALKECRRRKIPYIVTVHDAWWIADFQFLTDDNGRLIDPTRPLQARPPRGISLGDSLKRLRDLSRLLKDAEAVLAVSESFADIYRACGIKNRAIPNGIKTPSQRPARLQTSSRVRLAFVGGQSSHKGYHLIEAALRQGDGFTNLELTVVDHRRRGGEPLTTTWGATPVSFVGMTAQEAMGSFYERQDVLLAPSIWPESFGLVAREALAAGLWVVASDRGAMGEDVDQGVNGFVIDVSSPEGMFRALDEINRHPELYKHSPAPKPLRNAEDQAQALLNVYSSIISCRNASQTVVG